MADYTVRARLDAENKQIVLEVLDSAGAIATAWGQVVLTLGKDPGTTPAGNETTMGQPLAIRETVGCDPATGDPRYCFMLRSPWVETALTSDPET
jgi:hypothetical protein